MERVGIIGLGLMGSSMALALRENHPEFIIGGSDLKQEHQEYALSHNYIDFVLSLENISEIDLIFIAVPVNRVLAIIEEIFPVLNLQKTIVTDLGSTKEQIVKEVNAKFSSLKFVGGHPLTGREVSGPRGADKDLYKDKKYILVSNDNSENEQELKILAGLLEQIGSRVIIISSKKHDKILSLTSHLPQLLATNLVDELIENEREYSLLTEFIGTGFLDMTRIAASNAEMWVDIFNSNRKNIIKTLDSFIFKLTQFREVIENKNEEDIYEIMDRAGKKRRELK